MSSRISKTIEQILATQAPLFRFFTEGAWAHRDPADPENADFVAGNPQEVVMPEFVEALQRATVPTGKSYYAYKFSEPEAQAAAAAGLRERRGVPFEDADIAMVDGAFAGLIVSIRVVSDPGDEVIFLSPPWFFYEALIVASGATPVRVKLEPARRST